FTVTASPYPLQAQVTNDVSVLVGRLADSEVVLDARVTVVAESLEDPGEMTHFEATHANATNKLYYAANVVFPTEGWWNLTVRVEGAEGADSTSFVTEVAQPPSLGRRAFVMLAGFAAASAVVLVLLRFGRSGATVETLEEEVERAG
ncbi:MAG: hypothetical protein ACRERD_05130, partial [Candidatus Binatia bacterium]